MAWGHRWPRDKLPEPWKARQEFAFLFAFPNCACGFPGAAAGSGFHGRFCADLEKRGRHKEATMELPLTRIKGGRRGGPGAPRPGQRSPIPPAPPAPPGQGRGWLVAAALGQPRFQRWGHASGEAGGVESQPLSPRGSSCSAPVGSGARAGPRCSPCSHFLLFSANFPPSWMGCFLLPTSLPIQGPSHSLLCPSRKAKTGKNLEKPDPHTCCKPSH